MVSAVVLEFIFIPSIFKILPQNDYFNESFIIFTENLLKI